MSTSDRITCFDGEFDFLSNFYMEDVWFEGMTFPSNEHAYQAAKTTDMDLRRKIRALKFPGQAKRAGQKLQMRPGWDGMKVQVMRLLLQEKFLRPDMREKLLATGDAYIEEGNNWNDTFWGVCRGKGQNHLGKLIMEVRTNIREETNNL